MYFFVDRPPKMAKKKMSKKEFDEQFDAFLRDVSSIIHKAMGIQGTFCT